MAAFDPDEFPLKSAESLSAQPVTRLKKTATTPRNAKSNLRKTMTVLQIDVEIRTDQTEAVKVIHYKCIFNAKIRALRYFYKKALFISITNTVKKC
ncbi:MAG: hypothetical protein P1P74_03275 [Desulfuromonadales bacterium]|nr:hypothetical protein [Desulfuromonadales bacterium]